MPDTYVYPGTSVLVNLGNIRDQSKLDEYENTLVNLALIKLLDEKFKINSSKDVFLIHKKLFMEVYEWAGVPRTLNIFKNELVLNGLSVEYSTHSEIINELNKLDSVVLTTNWDKLSKPELIIELSAMISKLWRIHPFREGNTRTITTFLYFFLKNHDFTLNVKLLKENAKFFRNALVMSSLDKYSELAHLQNILNDVIDNKNASKKESKVKPSNEKYKTIKGIKMENYNYNYHAVKE